MFFKAELYDTGPICVGYKTFGAMHTRAWVEQELGLMTQCRGK